MAQAAVGASSPPKQGTQLDTLFVDTLAMDSSDEFPLIKKLPDQVIAKIAAGEVVQRPVNVLKELLENSLDAGSTSISVKCEFTKDDFKRIQIQDNGCGIKESDFAVACERFATSKISSYESLSNLNTFGFRGEALASISQVSILEILSKRSDSMIGFRQRYRDGRPIAPRPEATACTDGTIVTVHDLFYNNEHRKNSLAGTAAEFKRMVELVSLYSLDNLNVSFHMTKSQGKDIEISTQAGTSLRERISTVISSKTSSNLVDFQCQDDKLKFSASGVVGDLSSSLPNYRFVFFVNRRLVQFTSLHKSLEVFYKDKLAKGSCPFVFLSVQIEPSFVDANIHPSKNEVRLINEQDVVAHIAQEVETLLQNQKDREINLTSSSLKRPIANVDVHDSSQVTPSGESGHQLTLDSSFGIQPRLDTSVSSPASRPEQRVRHDLGSQRIDEMFQKQKHAANNSNFDFTPPRSAKNSNCAEEFFFRDGKRISNLESVRNLRKQIQDVKSIKLNTMLAHSSYVGSYFKGRPTLFIQYDVNLIQIDLPELTRELFYQIFIFNFGNLHQFKFDKPISIRNFAQIHMATKDEVNSQSGNVECQMKKLLAMTAMMNDYFSVTINPSGQIIALPELISGYIPSWTGLPEFAYDLLFNVNWTDEAKCFESFGRTLAKLYMATEDSCRFDVTEEPVELESNDAFENLMCDSSQENSSQNSSGDTTAPIEVLPPPDDPSDRKGVIASVLYPALKNLFLPSTECEKCFVLRTSVPQLYKVFHRC